MGTLILTSLLEDLGGKNGVRVAKSQAKSLGQATAEAESCGKAEVRRSWMGSFPGFVVLDLDGLTIKSLTKQRGREQDGVEVKMDSIK